MMNWLILTLLLLLAVGIFLLIRFYSRGNNHVPRTLEDQRRILRENVERLKKDEK